MISDQIKQTEGAARFLTRVLTGFPDSSLFDEYMNAEHFTGEEWDQAIETLTEFGNGPAVTERAVDFDAEREADRQALLVKAQCVQVGKCPHCNEPLYENTGDGDPCPNRRKGGL